MSPLLLAKNIIVICYIVVSAALVSGQGLYTYELCVAGTWVCLMFYITAKGFVYAFLVERVHIVRAPFVRRSKDKVYLACLVSAMLMYAGTSLNSYFWRVTQMHESDGRCHFGIKNQASIPILTVNVVTNITLTSVFFYLLRPVIKVNGLRTMSAALSRGPARSETSVQRNIKTLLRKSIIGAILIELPVAAKLIQSIVTGGKELGMMCLTFCMVDVFWNVVVIHWLTFGSSAAAENDILRSTAASSRQGLTRQQDSILSRCKSGMEIREIALNTPEPVFTKDADPEMAIWQASGMGPLSLPR